MRGSSIAIETELGANASHGTFREEEAIHAFDEGNDLAHLGSLEITEARDDVEGLNYGMRGEIICHVADNALPRTEQQSPKGYSPGDVH